MDIRRGATTPISNSEQQGPTVEARKPVPPSPPERRRHRLEQARAKRTDTDGELRSDLWRKGIEHFRAMREAALAIRVPHEIPPTPGGLRTTDQWMQIGPAPLRIDGIQQYMGQGPVSGEVMGIAIDPSGSTDEIIF